jgi:uncharacterized protein YjbI with pentapeptide repeats
MTRRMRVLIAGGVVLVVAAAGISWFAFVSSSDMGAGATSAKSLDEAKVPVSVVLSEDAGRLNVIIDWNDELDALRGDDRFTARLMAGNKEIALKQWEDTRPDVDTFTLEFTEAEATLLLAAVDNGDAVVAVTQQSDTDLDNDSLYEANYATVLRIQAPTASAGPANAAVKPVIQLASMQRPTGGVVLSSATVGTRDCSSVQITSNANLSKCDLSGVDMMNGSHGVSLNGADLSYANLTNAKLSGRAWGQSDFNGANFSYANLTGANLINANLDSANLTGADLTNADLEDALLDGAILNDVTLTGANLTGTNT